MLDPAVAAVRLAVRRTLADTDPVLVACSGGADSLALLDAAVFEGHRRGSRVVGVVVDHGLQQGSADHTDQVVAQMSALGADETVAVRVSVDARGQGVEAAAREARYAVLAEVAQRWESDLVLLGHTRDDQAETVLLGLTRGSGARALSGMRSGFDCFRRPLLEVTRAQTEAVCRARGLEWWDDPHNSDPGFTRARVRHRVLPVLEDELGPGVSDALARTADQLREDAEVLDDLADRAVEEVWRDDGVDAPSLARHPAAIRHRVLRSAALAAGCPGSELFRVHVVALASLVPGTGGGREIQLPGHVTAYRDGDTLRFRRTSVAG